MVRLSIVFFFCLTMCSLSFGSTSERNKQADKKLLELLTYKWNSPKKIGGKKEALSRARQLREVLQGKNGERGSQGKKGERGKKGKKGHKGSIGPRGPRGATGAPGPCGEWRTEAGDLLITFKPCGSSGHGFWQAIVISPSGKTYVTRADEASSEDVHVSISPVEIGVYTFCWKNGFEGEKIAHVLKEIEVDSTSFNGDHVFYNRLFASTYGEQRSISHVVIKETFK